MTYTEDSQLDGHLMNSNLKTLAAAVLILAMFVLPAATEVDNAASKGKEDGERTEVARADAKADGAAESDHPGSESIPATRRARTRRRPIAFQDDEGQWHLAPDFKSQLLTSCLHGVDIDAQAVEVTIMSLYLKMLEGKLPPNWQRDWLESQLLPGLDNNIRCGNSLLSQADFDRWWDNTHANLFAGDQDVRWARRDRQDG